MICINDFSVFVREWLHKYPINIRQWRTQTRLPINAIQQRPSTRFYNFIHEIEGGIGKANAVKRRKMSHRSTFTAFTAFKANVAVGITSNTFKSIKSGCRKQRRKCVSHECGWMGMASWSEWGKKEIDFLNSPMNYSFHSENALPSTWKAILMAGTNGENRLHWIDLYSTDNISSFFCCWLRFAKWFFASTELYSSLNDNDDCHLSYCSKCRIANWISFVYKLWIEWMDGWLIYISIPLYPKPNNTSPFEWEKPFFLTWNPSLFNTKFIFLFYFFSSIWVPVPHFFVCFDCDLAMFDKWFWLVELVNDATCHTQWSMDETSTKMRSNALFALSLSRTDLWLDIGKSNRRLNNNMLCCRWKILVRRRKTTENFSFDFEMDFLVPFGCGLRWMRRMVWAMQMTFGKLWLSVVVTTIQFKP